MKHRKRIISTIIILLAIVVTAAGILFLSLLVIYPGTDFDRLPVAAGATGKNFEIRSIDRIPFLWSYGIPYPTDFEETTHPVRSLNGTWKFKLDPDDTGEKENWQNQRQFDKSWKDTAVPSNYNTSESRHTEYEGIAWYARTFSGKPGHERDEFVRLAFRGVLLRCKVWLNGTLLGDREGGYTPFYFNITHHLKKDGNNVLVVRTDNRHTLTSIPPRIREDHTPGWHTYGGIYRDVYLETIPTHYIFKVMTEPKLSAVEGKLVVHALTHSFTRGRDYTLQCRVDGPGDYSAMKQYSHINNINFTANKFVFTINKPRPWSPGNPQLYTVTLTLASGSSTETVSFKTGLRTITVKDEKILLNGKPVFLKGISKHEDDPRLGAFQDKRAIQRDLSLIRDMNANYIRMAHYPHDVDEMYAARDMGFLLSEEIALYQAGMGFTAWFGENKSVFDFPFKTFGPKQMYNRTLITNAQRELVEMIERSRNNPAVIFWSVGNENYTLYQQGARPFGWLTEVVRAFDPARPVSVVEMSYGIPYFDTHRMASKYADIISVNMYYGWYYGTTDDVGPAIDSLHERFPGKPVIVSEFGASAAPGRSEKDGVWKADRVKSGKTYSEDYQEQLIRDYWNTIVSKDYVAGLSPWIFADFYCSWFPQNPIPNFNLKGVVSRERKPKQSYHALRKLYGNYPE